MAREIIYKGQDILMQLTLKNKRTGDALDLTEYTGYVIYVYNKGTDNVIAKFSKNAITGFGDIEEVDAENGVISINLLGADTKYAEVGDIDAELAIQQDNADFENGNFRTVGRRVVIGTIEDSLSSELTEL